jgi:60 kDa SS-A/Ro ribonucleoprotein
MMKYLKTAMSRKQTPQSQPIPGAGQVANSAGGYAFPVDDWVRMERFLILGSEGGSYYAAESTLTRENAEATLRCIQADGARAVALIAEISAAGRAPKTDPAIFALALAAATGEGETRRLALAALPRVCRTGTHLFHFAQYVDGLRGWGRGLRAAVANWYECLPADQLAYQAIKYKQRDGWTHRDLLRLSHPRPKTQQHKAIYHWITQGWPGVGAEPHPDTALRAIWAMERAAVSGKAGEVAKLIAEYDLPREAIPSDWLKEPVVWEALLARMPMTAMIRNLATMTRVGLLATGSDSFRKVMGALGDRDRLRKARIHPIAVLSALTTYGQGRGVRSDASWQPVAGIVDALDAAFYATFESVEPTGKRILLALDVSGSMGGGATAGVPGLTPRVGSAAMALVTAAVEKSAEFVAFTAAAGGVGGRWGGGVSGLTKLGISPRQRLDDVVKTVSGLPMGGTDCALPMVWALDNKVAIDTFVIYTDSETWHGKIHPVQALREYRERMGIAAKLVVVGMVSNGFSIADPNDAGMLDVVGFDTATPALIADFGR